jgi:PD-(D/E)XK nuclease superfamily
MNHQITNSELTTYKRCLRKWYLGYYLEQGHAERLDGTGPLALGNRVHAALEGYYGHGEDPLNLLNRIYELGHVAADDDPFVQKELQAEQALALLMLEGYLEWIEETGADEELTDISVEQTVTVPNFIKGVDLIGKLDVMAVKTTDKRRLFVDHKTVQNLADFIGTIDIYEQFPFYCMLLKIADPTQQIDGGIVNLLRKVKRTARATPPFYDRKEIHVNEQQLASMWRRTHSTVTEIMRTRRRLDHAAQLEREGKGDSYAHQYIAYPTPNSDCKWSCSFVGVCSQMDDGSRWQANLGDNFIRIDPIARYNEPSLREKANGTDERTP